MARTGTQPQRNGGSPTMWGRAERHAGNGADILFAQLAANDARRADAIRAVERVVARLRAGEWNTELAELVAHA
ncbi:MAG TPA: hypothetical protein VGR57_08520, partial [Ktedonobacterales bacterium]|nr:hypothetical protein [Ktedonobacterales bacterium]